MRITYNIISIMFFLLTGNMKVKKYFYLLIAAVMLTAAGCHDHGTDNQRIYGSGNLVTENRPVRGFNSVSVDGTADVQLIPANNEALRIEADDNIIGKVITEVEDGKLHIYLERGSYTNITVRAYVSASRLDAIECKGSASFTTAKPFAFDYIKCLINGTATVKLAGTANKEVIEINGTGTINNYDLEAKEATVAISGTGAVQVTAIEKLDATISGTGNITYAGDPIVVNQKVFGVGSINKKR